MNIDRFRVGMRVRYIGKNGEFGPKKFQLGVVKQVLSSRSNTLRTNNKVAVEFDVEIIDGHMCRGRCKSKRGYYFYNETSCARPQECYGNLEPVYNWRKL